MIDPQTEAMLSAFRRACRPPARLSPSAWATNRVAIQDGLTPKYDIAATPWMREPLDSFADGEAREVILVAPVGTGKTTFMEAGLAYCISEDPGPTLLVGQTDEDLKDWAETRMDHVVTKTREIADLLPSDRHKKRKMEILFPHMSLFLTGANLSGLQSKSMRRVLGDEAWMWRPGMIQEARGRLHDRWNRQIYFFSQAGVEGDDFDAAWRMTDQREYMWTCPSCGRVQQFRQAHFMIEPEGSDLERAQSSHIKCENDECDYIIRDDTRQRRMISEGCRYVATAQGMPGHIGYHYNVFANWRKPLWEIALMWIQANQQLAQGNTDPLRQYIQKRLAEPWAEDITDNRSELTGGGYLMAEVANATRGEDEARRFMTIDKQRDHFWVAVRAWRSDGSSRLLYFARVETWQGLDEVQKLYGVESRLVLIDANYDTDQVYAYSAERDWTALRGSRYESFSHPTKNGKPIRKPYSPFGKAQTSGGRSCRYAYWSSDRAKDIVVALRSGKGPAWEVPEDCPKAFLDQIDAEAKREIVNSKTKQVEYRWVKIRKDNHAFDLCAMDVVAALMLRMLPGFTDE